MGIRNEIKLLKQSAGLAYAEFKAKQEKQAKRPKDAFKKDFLKARQVVIKTIKKPKPLKRKKPIKRK